MINTRVASFVTLGVIFAGAYCNAVKECWMCPGGANSFGKCDQLRVKETCKYGTDTCGLFSFENKTGFRVFGKSCTYSSYCGDKDEFCQNVIGGGSYCRLQCCYTELCNYVADFRSTTPKPPTTTALPTTTEEPSTTEVPTTTEKRTTTELPTTSDRPTTTEVPTTTEEPITTEVPTTTGKPITTEVPTTTGKPTTTEVPTTTEEPSTTEEPTTTEKPITTDRPTTTEEIVTTRQPNATEELTTAEVPTSTEEPSNAIDGKNQSKLDDEDYCMWVFSSSSTPIVSSFFALLTLVHWCICFA